MQDHPLTTSFSLSISEDPQERGYFHFSLDANGDSTAIMRAGGEALQENEYARMAPILLGMLYHYMYNTGVINDAELDYMLEQLEEGSFDSVRDIADILNS